MLRTKIAGEFMIPLEEYPHVSQSCTLREVVELMEKSQLEVDGRRSLPRVVLVFDNNNQLMGIRCVKFCNQFDNNQLMGTVRRRDILRGLEPKFLSSEPMQYRKKLFDVKVDPNLAEISYEKMLHGILKRSKRLVNEVILPIAATVDYEDHIIKVIYEMVDNNVSLLPVLKEESVVGVVRSVDVLHEVAQILLS